MKISAAGEDLIKSFEGLFLHAYLCPAGVWTLGWGCTSGVKPGMVITQDQAQAMLDTELAKFEAAVNRLVIVPLTQHEFDALVSFAFNVGAGNLQASTLLKQLNAGNDAAVPIEMLKWDHFTNPKTHKLEVSAGLLKRRKAEAALFLDPDAQAPLFADLMPQSVSQPDKGKPMATTTTTVLSNPADAVIAAAQGALVDLKALAGSVAGALGSGMIATGAGLATTLMPTLSGEIAVGLVAFGGVLSAVVHGLIAMHLTSIANNATLLSVEKALNTTVTALGEPAISFENLAAAIPPATA